MKLLEDAPLNELLPGLRAGSEQAFNQLYKATFKPLYCKVRSMVKDEDIADELIQELYLRIWQKRESLNAEVSFSAFLFKIAQNLIYDYYRKAAKDLRLAAKLLAGATDYYLHSDVLLENKEMREILDKAINELSPQRAAVFKLCKLEGKSYAEAGHELGISVATVNSHMTQAIRVLKEYMLKNYEVGIILIACFVALSESVS